MSAFKTLQDASNNFETELREVSKVLHSAKIKGNFEDCVSEKIRQIFLFSAKLKLLRAKSLTYTSQTTEGLNINNTLSGYSEEAGVKIIDQLTVKSLTQSHAVKNLLTAPNKSLDPQQIYKKREIIEALFKYREKELQLTQLKMSVKLKRAEHAAVMEQWDRELGELRLMRNSEQVEEEINVDNPILLRVAKVVDKLEMMRWLLGKLVCSRGNKDWMSVPQQVCGLLKLARTPNTVEMFIED